MALTLSEFVSKLSDVVEALPVKKTVPSIWMQRFGEHFGTDPIKLPVVKAEYSLYQHGSLQRALDHYLADGSCSSALFGTERGFHSQSLSDLLESVNETHNRCDTPVRYITVPTGRDQTLTCVEEGLYLVSRDGLKLAIHISLERHDSLVIEVMALERHDAESFLQELVALIKALSIHRGQILSVGSSSNGSIKFASLDPISRDGLILPDGVIERIERHTVQMAEHRDLIRSAGLPVKRGILFHGAPGTGKTLTIRYLLGKMSGRTVLLVHGRGLSEIEEVCSIARDLEPATVVIEDVDLVAEDRRYSRTNPLLVELLNEMDGLSGDCDILFLLTTNRASVLEPALKSRPGRIDQVIEIPVPDEVCRRRLFDLYSHGVQLELDNLDKYVERTKGATPAFIREVVRKAALLAAIDGNGLRVRSCHFDAALQDLLVSGGELGKSLVGFRATGNDNRELMA
jgi:hypothetical protein